MGTPEGGLLRGKEGICLGVGVKVASHAQIKGGLEGNPEKTDIKLQKGIKRTFKGKECPSLK